MTGRALRVVIADDEPLARRRLARMLAEIGGAEVAGEAGDGAQTVAAVEALHPDLLLLDIRMPGGDGFAVIDRLGPRLPPVVFVTAFDRYALRAFETAAVDYLTKPVEPARLAEALTRVRDHLVLQDSAMRIGELQALVATLRQALREEEAPAAIWVKGRAGHQRLAIDRIDYVQAERDYVRLVSPGQAHLLPQGMGAAERLLAPHGFLRIHRSYLVRQAAIRGVQRGRGGALSVALVEGPVLRVGRSYARGVMQALGI